MKSKMMRKRILTLLLCTALMMNGSISAFADNADGISTVSSGDVSMTTQESESTELPNEPMIIVGELVEPTASPEPTIEPSEEPTATPEATVAPSAEPTASPEATVVPSEEPAASPEATVEPSEEPTASPEATVEPSEEPSASPEATVEPSAEPTAVPTPTPTTTVSGGDVDKSLIDVETVADWEATLPDLTGVYGDDVASIALSQLGYEQSEENTLTDEVGNVLGYYNRYGAWNGTPYADWNGLFVKFCVSYAQIPQDRFPLADDAAAWVAALSSEDCGMFVSVAEEYEPWIGDLVFFETDGIEGADGVAVITEVNDGAIVTIRELNGVVTEVTYGTDNESILGYGMMPFNMEGIEADTFDIQHVANTTVPSMYDQDTPGEDNEDADESSEKDSIMLGKKVNSTNDTDIFELVLDAYVTGENVEVDVPVDIILVLDRSGSMVQSAHFLTVQGKLIKGCTYYKKGVYTGGGANQIKSYPVVWCDTCEQWEIRENDKNGNPTEEVKESLGANPEGTFYETNMQATERSVKTFLDQIKNQGDSNRVAIVSYGTTNDNGGYDKNGKLSVSSGVYRDGGIVGYFTDNRNDAPMYKDVFLTVNDKNMDELIGYVEEYADISRSGTNTATHVGTYMADRILLNNPVAAGENRKQMVVLFADGAPGTGKNYSVLWSKSAINTAQVIKNEKDASIYVVGLYKDANASDTFYSDVLGQDTNSASYANDKTFTQTIGAGDANYYHKSNRLFNLISSNLSNVTTGDTQVQIDGAGKTDYVTGVTRNTDGTSYFYGAENANELQEAFEKVSKSSENTATVSLDATTVLRDQISPYFTHYCTCGAADTAQHTCITVYTEDWIIKEDTEGNKYAGFSGDLKQVYPEESQDEEVTDIAVEVVGKAVNVTGFSYENFPVVTYTDQETNELKAEGKRLVVKVNVETEAGFWGGNNVPTNEAPSGASDITGSAIYKDNTVVKKNSTDLAAFPMPEANVPLRLDIVAQNKTIYYGGEVEPADLVKEITAGYKTYGENASAGKKYVVMDENGKWVPAKLEDGKLVVDPESAWMAEYADITVASASGLSNIDCTENNEISATMTAKYNGAENRSENPSNMAGIVVNTSVEKDYGDVHILIPVITFQDSVVNFGFAPEKDYYEGNNRVADITWVHQDVLNNLADLNDLEALKTNKQTEDTFIPLVDQNTKPNLTFSYTSIGEKITEDTPIQVTVTSDNVDGQSADITSIVAFTWKCVVNNKDKYHQSSEDITTPHAGNSNVYEFWLHTYDKPYELPSTGGSGTLWYTISGLMLMLGAALILDKNKYKEVLRQR